MSMSFLHRWAHLLKKQSPITVDRLITREKKLPFPFPLAANKWKFAVSILFLQQTSGIFFAVLR
jgi:hypothetical protein